MKLTPAAGCKDAALQASTERPRLVTEGLGHLPRSVSRQTPTGTFVREIGLAGAA